MGPAKHLGHADLTAWLRANRSRRLSYRLSERTSGAGNGQRGEGARRRAFAALGFALPALGGRRAGDRTSRSQLLDASDVTGLKVSVNANSFLQQSLTPNDTFAITGLGAAIAVAVGDAGLAGDRFRAGRRAVTAASISSRVRAVERISRAVRLYGRLRRTRS